jgi:hypothetical protein
LGASDNEGLHPLLPERLLPVIRDVMRIASRQPVGICRRKCARDGVDNLGKVFERQVSLPLIRCLPSWNRRSTHDPVFGSTGRRPPRCHQTYISLYFTRYNRLHRRNHRTQPVEDNPNGTVKAREFVFSAGGGDRILQENRGDTKRHQAHKNNPNQALYDPSRKAPHKETVSN